MSQEVSLENSIYSVCADCPDCGEHQREPSMQCLNCGTMLVKGLRSGTVIADRYEYLEPIGAGGMGLIVKAADRTTGNEVAVKLLLHNDSAADNRRFQVEAKAASMLTHKHIVHVLDFGLWAGHSPYMVMDYVVGSNLDTVIAKNGCLEVIETLEIFDQICDAMDYAHSKRIVHRDLKPSNIMLTGKNQDFVKIVDFGIAKILDKTTLEKSLTKTGQLIGSPLYMSPEQANGKKVDVRTDIYSAGCVLYHALSGAPPLEGKTTIETLFKHLHDVPPSMSESSLGKKFDPLLEEIVAKTLGKNPDERYQSFEELRADLEKAYPDGTQAPAGVVAAQTTPSKAAIICGVIAVGLIASGAAGYYFINAAKKVAATVAPSPVVVSAKSTHVGEQPLSNVPKVDLKNKEPASGTEMFSALDKADPDPTVGIIDRQIEGRMPDYHLPKETTKDENIGYLSQRIHMTKAPIDVLDLMSTSITNQAITYITKLPLKTLILERTKITGQALEDIAEIKTLEELNLSGVKKITAHDLTELIQLKKLKSLNLAATNIYGPDLAFICKMPQLETLDLHSMPQFADSKAFENIANQHHISTLRLDWTGLSDDDLKSLSKLRSLQTLSIMGAHTSNKGLEYLANLRALRNLNLSRTKINHDSVPLLKKLNLTRLVLWECNALSADDLAELRAKFGTENVLKEFVTDMQHWDAP